MNEKLKSQLESFTKYCQENPDQRFWQALRNWSKYSFIFGASHSLSELTGLSKSHFIEDTFYKEE